MSDSTEGMKFHYLPMAMEQVMPNVRVIVERARVVEREGKLYFTVDETPLTPELQTFMRGGAVGPGQIVVLRTRPQVLYRTERICIEAELAPAFKIVDFRVGKSSQLPTADPIDAAHFAGSKGPNVKFETAQISMDLTITLMNCTDKPVRVPKVTLFGSVYAGEG